MSNLGVSPLYLEYKNRYDAQPQDIKDKLDSFRSSNYQLKLIKRKNTKINLGDVFVLSPREN